MNYKPKRARRQWLEGAPEYVLSCYDSGPETGDRYTVLLGGSLYSDDLAKIRAVEYLGMNSQPEHPCFGVSQCGQMHGSARSHLGRHVRWLDLPEHIRAHVVARCTPEPVTA